MPKPAPQLVEFSTLLSDHPAIAKYVVDVISLWNLTEYIAAGSHAFLIGTDPFHSQKMLYALRNSVARIDVFEASCEHALAGEPLVAMARDLVKKLRAAVRVRNFYAHAIYALDARKQLVVFNPNEDWPKSSNAVRLITESDAKERWGTVKSAYSASTFFQQKLRDRFVERGGVPAWSSKSP